MLAAQQDLTATEEGVAKFQLALVARPTLDSLPPGSVLIRSVASSICGSDLYGKGAICGCEWRVPLDYIHTKKHSVGGTGHEVIGDVAETVPPCEFKVGDRVLAMVPS